MRINPRFAFIEQPRTNAMVEPFLRTLKEQGIHDRGFRVLKEVREAVRGFLDLYNGEWLLGQENRMGYNRLGISLRRYLPEEKVTALRAWSIFQNHASLA